MSTNKSPLTSRYNRKENYQSLNFPITSNPVSPFRTPYTNNDQSAIKKSIQQKQIQDLEQKVDLILEHNNKLSNENTQLKIKLTQAEEKAYLLFQHNNVIQLENNQLKRRVNEYESKVSNNMQFERLSRYQIAQESQYAVRKLNSQLMIKGRQLQHIVNEFKALKEINNKEHQSMQQIINGLTNSNETLKLQNSKLRDDIGKIREEIQAETRFVVKQVERRAQQEIIKMQKEKIDQINRQKQYNNKLIEQFSQKFEQERNDWQNRKNMLINKLQQNHNKEINELRDQMNSQFEKQIQKLQQENVQKCREQREKADKFIKEYTDSFGASNDSQNQELKQQIKLLLQSLQSRKKLLSELTSEDIIEQNYRSSFNEVLQMKLRLKEQIEHMMRETQLLKVKMAEQYQRDLKETVKIYEDKIEVLSAQVVNLSDQNDRLRHNYEDEVTNRIKQRRTWEIQVGQLKNLIRKLKVELQGVQEQFRLNIDGVRDQNATFSMTLMKSMITQRDKGNFFEEQNRKLRAMYEKHEVQVDVQKKQVQQKVKYYQNKIEHMKKLIQDEKRDLHEKELMLQNKHHQRERNLRQDIRKERERMQQLISEADEAKQKIYKEYFENKDKLESTLLELKQARDDINSLKSKLKENEEYIQRLKMELDMAGVDDTQRTVAINHWKQHYESIILKLEEDKKQLKAGIDSQNQNIQKLIYKYRLLEQELKGATLKIKQKGQLDKKIIQLGLDENLVKNMAQLWLNKDVIPQQ